MLFRNKEDGHLVVRGAMQFINASSSRAVDVQEVVRTFSPCFGPPSKSFAHKELEGSP